MDRLDLLEQLDPKANVVYRDIKVNQVLQAIVVGQDCPVLLVLVQSTVALLKLNLVSLKSWKMKLEPSHVMSWSSRFHSRPG